MNVKKLALLLILLLSLALVACGGGATEEPVAGEETGGETVSYTHLTLPASGLG